jgi:hypothetical protein
MPLADAKPLYGGLYNSDLFINLADREAQVERSRPSLKVDCQPAPMCPEIFEGPSIAELHIRVDDSFDGFCQSMLATMSSSSENGSKKSRR